MNKVMLCVVCCSNKKASNESGNAGSRSSLSVKPIDGRQPPRREMVPSQEYSLKVVKTVVVDVEIICKL